MDLPAGSGRVWTSLSEPSSPRWYVLRLRSRQEKLVSGRLSAMGISHLLPLIREPRCYGRRTATVELPLFPGYLFLWATPEEKQRVEGTDRVVSTLPIPDQSPLYHELSKLRLASGAEPRPVADRPSGPTTRVHKAAPERDRLDGLRGAFSPDVFGQPTLRLAHGQTDA